MAKSILYDMVFLKFIIIFQANFKFKYMLSFSLVNHVISSNRFFSKSCHNNRLET